MPGYELFDSKERDAINELFDANGGVLFAHGFDGIRNGIFKVREFEKITTKKFGAGSKAPQFSLKDKTNQLIALSEFKGKPIYINFWTNWSIPSQKEMKIMEVLNKKYKNKIHFISICADNDFEKMTTFLTKNPSYNWNFLHLGNNKKILADYKVVTFPTYVLVDKNQTIIKAPAGRPGGTAERATEDNIEKDFYELTN